VSSREKTPSGVSDVGSDMLNMSVDYLTQNLVVGNLGITPCDVLRRDLQVQRIEEYMEYLLNR
jgi:hypothetical protein